MSYRAAGLQQYCEELYFGGGGGGGAGAGGGVGLVSSSHPTLVL